MKKRLVSLFLVLFFSLSFCFMSFAVTVSDLPAYNGDGQWKRIFVDKGDGKYYGYLGFKVTSYTSPVYCYWLHRPSDNANWMFLVSKDKFSCSRYGYRSFSSLSTIPSSSFSGDGTMDVKLEESGYYVGYFGLSSDSISPDLISFDGPIPLIYCEKRLWDSPDYVLGEDPSGGGSFSSIVYDASIPAPENLKFEEKSKSFGFISGSKFEHCLTWSNGVSSSPLYVRVSGVANAIYDDTGQVVPDSMLYLLPESPDGGTRADSGSFIIGADDIKAKLLQGTTLLSMEEYRVQFYRYVDGKLNVGPISTVHLNYNKLGKYIGYTVTTDTPKDVTDLGVTGGMDDYYQNNWTSDGEHYDEYDKDGNLIGSGTSEDNGNFLQKLINSLINIPTVINEFFKSLQSLMTGVGDFPALLSQLFSFLPVEIIGIVGLGITVVIVLRILGR